MYNGKEYEKEYIYIIHINIYVNIYIYTYESLHCIPETNTTL